jgi:hypothetical protein
VRASTHQPSTQPPTLNDTLPWLAGGRERGGLLAGDAKTCFVEQVLHS